jgi:hypothetical protein
VIDLRNDLSNNVTHRAGWGMFKMRTRIELAVMNGATV